MLFMAMGAMGIHCDIHIALAGSSMGGNPLSVMKYLDRGGGKANLHFLADKHIGNAVPGTANHNMIVDVNFGFLPFPKLEPLYGKSFERRFVDLLNELIAGLADPLHGTII